MRSEDDGENDVLDLFNTNKSYFSPNLIKIWLLGTIFKDVLPDQLPFLEKKHVEHIWFYGAIVWRLALILEDSLGT